MKLLIASLVIAAAAASSGAVFAQKQYAPGITDTEIKIGQTFSYSGPASPLSSIAKAHVAYFKMLNEKGGVNGRRINLLSLDDGFLPPRTIEQTRKLVEQENVAFIFGSVGTASNLAVRSYLNTKKIPQIFLSSPTTDFGDHEKYPWTMGWASTTQVEGAIFARYILSEKPNAKIGVLHQNGDFGLDYVRGIRRGLGDKGDRLVSVMSYENTDATIDSQMTTLRAAGADTFVSVTPVPKFASQSVAVAHDSGWKPFLLLASYGSSVGTSLKSAGFEKARGIISAQFFKDPTDPQWARDPGMLEWREWLKKYYPGADDTDQNIVYGYLQAQTLVQVLKQCGDDLSRENIMKQAANLKNIEFPMLVPGVKLNTSPTDYYPVQQMQMWKFDGARWQTFGPVISD